MAGLNSLRRVVKDARWMVDRQEILASFETDEGRRLAAAMIDGDDGQPGEDAGALRLIRSAAIGE